MFKKDMSDRVILWLCASTLLYLGWHIARAVLNG